MNIISSAEAKSLIDANKAVLFDVRESYERDICSIDCEWIPMAEVSERVSELPTDKTIIFMCRTGKRAEAVANLMSKDFGLNNIMILEGGILGWNDTHNLNLDTEL